MSGLLRGDLPSSHPDIPLDSESFDCVVPPRVMYWESMSLSLFLEAVLLILSKPMISADVRHSVRPFEQHSREGHSSLGPSSSVLCSKACHLWSFLALGDIYRDKAFYPLAVVPCAFVRDTLPDNTMNTHEPVPVGRDKACSLPPQLEDQW